MSLEVAIRCESEVGEGPLWDGKNQELVWVDVTRGLVHRHSFGLGYSKTLEIGKHVGAVGLYSEERFIAAIRDGLVTIDRETGAVEYLSRVLQEDGIRFNDGKCDPFGRFVAGTMRYQPAMGTAALYACDVAGRTTTLLEGVGLSNGLCWSESGRTLYYIDTLTKQIASFDYEKDFDRLGERRVIYSFSEQDGSPDGMTIDQSGALWVALWGGRRVVSIDASGKLVSEIPLPVSKPTSVVFGGPRLDQLFITSANYQLTEAERANEPLAGSVFVTEVGVSGFAEPRFGVGR